LGTTTGHSFNRITGDGRVLMAADNFPSGDATHFVTAGQGEGIVELYGTNFTLSNGHTFYDVVLNTDASSNIVTLTNDLSINGDLTITQGTLQINDNSSTTVLNINVAGDINVAANGSITVGTGNTANGYSIPGSMPAVGSYHSIYHQFVVQGNFTNYGTVTLTNLTAPKYDDFATNGAVSLRFEGEAHKQFYCYNTTDIYNLVIDKGTNQTYYLELYADNISYFHLFGANSSTNATAGDYSASNPEVRKALWIKNGILKLTGSTSIPTLTEGGDDYVIGNTGKLWIAGANVSVYSTASAQSDIFDFTTTAVGVDAGTTNSALHILGQVEIDNGILDTRNSTGIVYSADAVPYLTIDGGAVNMQNLHESGTADMSYAQTGGIVTLSGGTAFDLSEAANVFYMSGGTIELQSGDFLIGAQIGNYGVTGGTVLVKQDGGSTPVVNTSAPIYNFELERLNASGDLIVDLGYELIVLNDITVNANTAIDHQGNDVTIGGNFSIDADAASTDANNYGYLYDTAFPNTTTFNGNNDATFYIGHPFDDDWELILNSLVLNKASGKSLTVQSSPEKEAINVSQEVNARIIKVKNTIIYSGILNQGNQSIRCFGPINISSAGKLGVYEHGTTHINALIMLKSEDVIINTEDGAELGNVKMATNSTAIASLTSDVKIDRVSYRKGRINVGKYKLTIDYLHKSGTTNNYNISEGNALTEMIYMDGNSSDGGLRLLIPDGTVNGTVFGFPVGVSGKYTPVEIKVSDIPAGGGYIQVNPVDDQMPTASVIPGDILDYYWRVRHDGFTSAPNVIHEFFYDETDISGIEANYYPGKVSFESLPFTRSYINDKNRVDNTNNIITYDDGAGGYIALEKATFTAGNKIRLDGTLVTFYNDLNSAGPLDWNTKASWTKTSTDDNDDPNKLPAADNVIVIRGSDATNNVRIASGDNVEVAAVIFERNGTYTNMDDLPQLVIDANASLTVGFITGTGDLVLEQNQTSNATVTTDMGEFAANDTSVVQCYTTEAGVYNVSLVNFFDELPTLRVNGANNSPTVTFDYNLNAKNLVIDGDAQLKMGGNITVDSLTRIGYVNGGEIQFPAGASAYELSTLNLLTGTEADNSATYAISVESGGSNATEHTLLVRGDIDLNKPFTSDNLTFDLYNAFPENSVVLKLQGASDNSFSNAFNSEVELYRVELNKGANATNSFTMNSDFSLNGTTSGIGNPKALNLQNGNFIVNNSNINVPLTTGDDHFTISSTSKLTVTSGTLTASGSSGISLDGQLLVNGGTVDMSGGDNPIEYSASGNAAIELSSGLITVGSQVCRALISETGALSYTQSGGTFIAGETSAPNSNRATFEVLGVGSSFNHSAGVLQIGNGQANATIASVYLDPETYNLGSGTAITLDPVQSSGIEEIGIYSAIPLQNLTLAADANLSVKQWEASLTVTEDMEIGAGATYDANAFELILNGDFTVNGNYEPSGNTTIFNGTVAQTITGDVVFYNLTKNGSESLNIQSGDISVSNELIFNSGTLNQNSNQLYVEGNCHFAGIQNYGGGGNGITLRGIEAQELTGGGTLSKLTLRNDAGVNIPVGNEFTITENLRMETGVFNIDKNLLTLEENCTISEVNPFSESNMIRTNISFTDNGVKKILPAGVSSFTYPIGSVSKYTPVTLTVTANDNNTGSLTVKPANEYHPSVLDPNNVLQYHWNIRANGISGFTADMILQYESSDIQGDINNYITASLLSDGSGNWLKDFGIIDQVNSELEFSFTGANDASISGDYTAGLDAAIPDQIPAYITIASGDWTDENNWDTYPTGGTVPAGGPKKSRVIIEHTITVPNNCLLLYETTINSNGTIDLGSTFGHRLGEIDGTGKLKVNDMLGWPAGVYTEFFSPAGGTVEFAGTTDYDIPGSLSSVNNMILSGSGERRLPNADITFFGDLTISGTDVVVDPDNSLTIKGNLTFSSGTFNAGSGMSNITFSGNALQNINGPASFTGINAFNHFTVNAINVININTNVDIDGILYLTDGIINNKLGNDFTVTNSLETAVVGGSSSSYIEGSFAKKINNGGQFEFPVGDGVRYGNIIVSETVTSGAQNWKVRYFNNSPANEGYDPMSLVSPIEYVGKNEYWSVEGPNAAMSKLTLRWDGASGVNPDANFRVVKWTDLATDAWGEVNFDTPTGDASGGTVKITPALSYSDFSNTNYLTYGSILIPAYTWMGTTSSDWFTASNWSGSVVPNASSDVTIDNVVNDPVIDPAVNTNVVQVNNLTINSGATLTVLEGSQMTVNGDLITNNGLILQNSNTAPTSFINNGTVTGNVQINWSYEEQRYWYIGHAISNPNISSYDALTPGNPYHLYVYPNNAWVSIGGTTYSFTAPLEGMAFKAENPGATITHTGTLNNGACYSTILGAKWHLIANPYASYLDLAKTSEWSFGDALSTVWTTTTLPEDIRGYATFNIITGVGLNGGSRYVAPGQALWVKSYLAGSTLEVKSGARVHAAGMQLKSASQVEENVLRIE
jgi:hypothetical protein